MTALPEPAPPDALKIEWCEDNKFIEPAADFFMRHVDSAYIGQSDIMYGRAVSPSEWSIDLRGHMIRHITECVMPNGDDRDTDYLAVAQLDGRIVGIALFGVTRSENASFAILHDIVVDTELRGLTIGRRMIEWLADEARSQGVSELFLESASGNQRAHRLFYNLGFKPLSINMMRKL